MFADSTCIGADIHFPVDWVLLRDASRTLINAVVSIRKHGLKHRIPEPKSFVRRMNKLCMEMAGTRRKKDAHERIIGGRKAARPIAGSIPNPSGTIWRKWRWETASAPGRCAGSKTGWRMKAFACCNAGARKRKAALASSRTHIREGRCAAKGSQTARPGSAGAS